jgi:hypothetical protein
MNIYVNDSGFQSISILRIISAFKDYSPPSIHIVDNLEEADLVLLHIYGRINNIKKRISYLKSLNKQYAIMQYTLRHSLNPKTTDWLDVWNGSVGVWSYLNLLEMLKQDGEKFNFNFYYAPLGVDTKIFQPGEHNHNYQILTTGKNYMTEGVRECAIASEKVRRKAVHFGFIVDKDNVDSFVDADNNTYVIALNNSDYVAGLRRGEGFELPAAEGLVCGVRPILFNAPHYCAWYNNLGLFVQENSREILINDLKDIFLGEERPVTKDEIEEARSRFDWSKLITGFWNNLWIH